MQKLIKNYFYWPGTIGPMLNSKIASVHNILPSHGTLYNTILHNCYYLWPKKKLNTIFRQFITGDFRNVPQCILCFVLTNISIFKTMTTKINIHSQFLWIVHLLLPLWYSLTFIDIKQYAKTITHHYDIQK